MPRDDDWDREMYLSALKTSVTVSKIEAAYDNAKSQEIKELLEQDEDFTDDYENLSIAELEEKDWYNY